MRVRLSYKIFGAFILTSLVIVCLTFGALRFFSYRNFVAYLDKVEMEKLDDLSEMVKAEYAGSGGWQRLREKPDLWHGMARRAGHKGFEPPGRPPGEEHGGPGIPPGPPEPPGMDSREFETHNRPPGAPPDFDRKRGMEPDGRRPPPPPGRELFMIDRRIFLLDEERRPVAGPPGDTGDMPLREIALDGKAVGWLGIRKDEPRMDPPEAGFLRSQDELFSFIGAGILILSTLVSFFLSRHLLAPVRLLTEGTKALASRKFATRLEVRSGDELGQLAADFNAMAQTLDQYETMRKQWISDISHELRTPLSILKGEIEAMQDGIRAMNRPALDSLHSEVCHLARIVEDLHQLSVADTGKLHLDRKPVDPIRVLEDMVGLFRLRFEQAGIAIREEGGAGREITIPGDENRLRQLYSNILENTLRYADTPGTLAIRHESSSSGLVISFEDSGPGVPPESLDRLFDRLYRVSSSRTRSTGGSGLGLALCKTIVEIHGGSISASNGPSGGLRIEIALPLSPALSS